MIAKEINSEEFKKAIRIGFEKDNAIYPLYNPNIQVSTVDEIVEDIFNRIKADVRDIIVKGVYDKDKLIGYYVCDEKTLVSFALNVEYRKRKYLHAFWDLIRKDLRGMFQAFMWTRNQRGIKWLQKNNMKIVAADNLLTHLIF